MPKNRRSVPKEDRLAEIVGAARVRFVEHGFQATRISDIGRDLGIASGAIHWYFPTKVDLFAAVLEDIVTSDNESGADYTSSSPQQDLVTFLTEREPYRLIHHDAHSLLTASQAVSAAHDQLHTRLNSMLLAAVAEQLPVDTELTPIEETAHYLLEGILTTPKRDRSIEEVIDGAITALVATARSNTDSV